MAVPTGGGSETLHSSLFEDVVNSAQSIITGVQHHTYSVLSIIMHCTAMHEDTNDVRVYLVGYDRTAGGSAQEIQLLRWDANLYETFSWNDRFSFFGKEGGANTQAGAAAQAGAAVQYLKVVTGHADCKVDVTCTYIDQDWS
tara:strand:- start:882 stop:1307 length:426 start_codon:yes stop_codon:yes gene_type:complete